MSLSRVDWDIVGPVGLIVVGVLTLLVYFLLYRVNVRQSKAEKRFREKEARFQENIETIQRRHAEATERMAESIAQLLAQEQPPGAGTATLSASFEKEGRTDRLVVMNRGPGSARVVSVECLTDPSLLVEPLCEGMTLLEGEECTILAAPSLATPPTVTVRMSWMDARGIQSREQTLNL